MLRLNLNFLYCLPYSYLNVIYENTVVHQDIFLMALFISTFLLDKALLW